MGEDERKRAFDDKGESMSVIGYAATEDTITVWWEKPETAVGETVYRIWMDGRDVQEVSRTHAQLTGLAPDREYRIRVTMGVETVGEAVVHTGKIPRRWNVMEFGAVGDGITMNTAALQKAIDACGPGEEVYLPAGTYRTGALHLHSGMRLHLCKDAILQGTDDPADYLPKIPSRFEGTEMMCYQSLLNLGEMDHAAGTNCRDVVIDGEGTISGGGVSLMRNTIEAERERLKDYIASLGEGIRAYQNEDVIPGRARGRLINLSNCENIRISGLTLQNGAAWNVHMIYSRGIVTDHCVFRSEGIWNGDGWDPDSSEDCTLFACTFYTEDDSVAIKSGKNPEGNRIGRPSRRIRVFDCRSEFGLGIALGSEMSGGIEDVRIWDCDLAHSLYGVQIKATRKRGGYVRHVTVRDCKLSRFLCCAVTYNDDGEGAQCPPVLSDFRCEGTEITGWARNYDETEEHEVAGIDLSGFDLPGYEACRIAFENCRLEGNARIVLKNCREVTLNVQK